MGENISVTFVATELLHLWRTDLLRGGKVMDIIVWWRGDVDGVEWIGHRTEEQHCSVQFSPLTRWVVGGT